MPDRTFLDWPFFEPRHRALALDLDAWATENLTHVDHADTDAACRQLVALLGRDGWLTHSAIDPGMVDQPGHHIMSLSVRGVPYHLAEGTWDEQRDELGRAVVETIAQHMPNVPDILDDVHVYTPLDLEREWEVGEAGYESRSENCCFAGRRLHGTVVATVAAGAVAYRRRTLSVVGAA